eukprot:2192527-Amphidinium_carterae.2
MRAVGRNHAAIAADDTHRPPHRQLLIVCAPEQKQAVMLVVLVSWQHGTEKGLPFIAESNPKTILSCNRYVM